MVAAAALATPVLYPAFFFVLEKAVKSAGNAVIPTYPMHRSHGLQHLRHKRPTFAFTSESGLHTRLCSKDRTHGLTRRNRGLPDRAAITTLGAFRTFTNIPGPGVRTANFAAFGSWPGVRSRRTQRACGAAMRLCASLLRGVAAPLGRVICLQLGDVTVFSLCAQYFLNVRGGGGITTLGAFHTFRKPCVARG